jgi:hypothetical protein
VNTLIKRASWPNNSVIEISDNVLKKSEELKMTTHNSDVDCVAKYNPLSGYDASMRRHAAACEAGR